MNLDFSDIKVLLIGDFMIDHYIIGKSERMSPEAPVPVVIPKERIFNSRRSRKCSNEFKINGCRCNMFGSCWK